MNITPDQLFEEASIMALELRIKDRMIGELQAENARLRGTAPGDDHGHAHSHDEAPQGGGD